VIAPLLIIQRVANRSALTSDTIVTGTISSFHVGGRGELTSCDRTLPAVYPMKSADRYEKNTDGPGVRGAVTTIDLRPGSEV